MKGIALISFSPVFIDIYYFSVAYLARVRRIRIRETG
jgi:hypothetical protein